jgi:hypothetical protein
MAGAETLYPGHGQQHSFGVGRTQPTKACSDRKQSRIEPYGAQGDSGCPEAWESVLYRFGNSLK